ncbi:hypothetical protein [Streptomyces actinomycinicus]|nr:hypothetical protein [Streptomyces actinomycinicus]
MAIAGIAATVGAVGRPVAQAVQAVIGMLAGQPGNPALWNEDIDE